MPEGTDPVSPVHVLGGPPLPVLERGLTEAASLMLWEPGATALCENRRTGEKVVVVAVDDGRWATAAENGMGC